MDIILDTNFIISCVREKIDFLDILEFGKPVIPELVIEELEKLELEERGKDREIVKLAMKILNKRKSEFRLIKLEKKFVDAGIKVLVDKSFKEGNIIGVATLDRGLKSSISEKARIFSLISRKKLGFL